MKNVSIGYGPPAKSPVQLCHELDDGDGMNKQTKMSMNWAKIERAHLFFQAKIFLRKT